jgi:Transposase DDE domain
VLANLDALLTALYVRVDDFLPGRSGPGRPPGLTDAELIAPGVAQMFLRIPNDRKFLALATWRLGHLFPYLPQQPGYNKRLRRLAPTIAGVITHLAVCSPSFCDNLRLLDNTPVPCGQSRETARRSELAGYAAYGWCESHGRYFWGFRLYLLCAADGVPIAFELAPANAPERVVAAEMLGRVDLDGYTVMADKGFAGDEFEQLMAALGARFLRPDRRDEPTATDRLVRCANGSSRCSGPARASSPSRRTAAASSRASAPASHSGSWPSPPASCTTTTSVTQAATSPPTATDTESTI